MARRSHKVDWLVGGGFLGAVLIGSAADISNQGLTCTICDSPQFVACNASTTASTRCAGAKGNELRVFCADGSRAVCTLPSTPGKPALTVTCTNPTLRYGVDAHGLPDKTQYVLSCS